jgi:anionic cell wall polymer biosynthesis LytR-Cps2A-Psr (LCP) family protein
VVSTRLLRLVAGKIGYTVSCLLAVVVVATSWYAHQVVGLTTRLSNGASIGASPSIGAMNILVMGLESRTNFEGQNLTAQQLTETHSGKESDFANGGSLGSQDTDTLILIHIFAGGQRAVGFSIPRDSVVNYPQTLDVDDVEIPDGKIDEAYAWAYDVSEQQTSTTSLTQAQRAHLANQAGELFETRTVEALTGVTVNHFVESNLIGFYSLAQEFGGIEVCLKPAPAQGGFVAKANLSDYDPLVFPHTNNSGFNAVKYDGYDLKQGGAQYLHLSAAQSLAYVRSRDTLPGIDIGRTARQQAAIDYVIYQLKHDNYFSSLDKLTAILGGASNYLVTDKNFNLIDFATNMRALTGKNMHLTTLPGTPENQVAEPGFPNGQDIISVNVPKIQRMVQNAFYPQPAAKKTTPGTTKKAATVPSPSTVTVDVYNGGTKQGLATSASQALVALGYRAGAVADAPQQSQAVTTGTQVFYGAGTSANAARIAAEFGTTATALTSLPAGHVEVLLGSASTAVPADLASSGPSTAGTQSTGVRIIGTQASASSTATPAASPTAGSGSGTGGDSVAVAPNAKFGIPCVY